MMGLKSRLFLSLGCDSPSHVTKGIAEYHSPSMLAETGNTLHLVLISRVLQCKHRPPKPYVYNVQSTIHFVTKLASSFSRCHSHEAAHSCSWPMYAVGTTLFMLAWAQAIPDIKMQGRQHYVP